MCDQRYRAMYFFDAEQLGRSAHFVCRLGPTHAVKLFGFVSESTARPFCQSLQKPLVHYPSPMVNCRIRLFHQRGLFLRQNQGLMSAMAMFQQLSVSLRCVRRSLRASPSNELHDTYYRQEPEWQRE